MFKMDKNVSFQNLQNFGVGTRKYSGILPRCETPLGFNASATCELPSIIQAGLGFEGFYAALSNKHSLLLTSSHKVQSLSLALNLYFSFSVALSTYFSQHLTGCTTITSYPAFLSYYIIQVTNSVHSKIKNGSLLASTVFVFTPSDHFKVLEQSMGLKKDNNGQIVSFSLSNGLENTALASLSLSDFLRVHGNVKSFCESISSGESTEICHKVLHMYQILHLASHPKSRLIMTDDIEFNKVSSSMGIFRYHRYKHMWIANCYSLDSVTDHAIAMQYSFLGLFNPDISYSMVGHTETLQRTPQPGDRVIDLSEISSVDYWKTIMSGGRPQPAMDRQDDLSSRGKAPQRESGSRSYSTYSRHKGSYSSVFYDRLGETVYFTLEDENSVLLHSRAYLYY
jgi:hypothetical protein